MVTKLAKQGTLAAQVKQLVDEGTTLEQIAGEYLRQHGWTEYPHGRGLWNHDQRDYWAITLEAAMRAQARDERPRP